MMKFLDGNPIKSHIDTTLGFSEGHKKVAINENIILKTRTPEKIIHPMFRRLSLLILLDAGPVSAGYYQLVCC
jgi:hypothetical protein